ncbi:alpha-1,2-fucosyltransferase [Flavobacterium sp. ZS1P14]|uniref:alpha-1,2-fucosyltransferase n=1 Tax=Flavobacterium sp. ZS1P14 TaxID=3401729 RepID=UPI003AB0BD27
MIIIKLKGGLGNQMFQYAFASILAKKNNAIIKIEKSFFDLTEKTEGHTPRNFELGIFDNSYNEAMVTDILFFNQLSIINKLKRDFGFNFPKIYNEFSFDFHKTGLLIKTPVYIKGYFQSYKYFVGHEDFINKIFAFPIDTLDKVNKKILSGIKGTTTISIHIRRGDYVNDKVTQQFHGNCSLGYYFNAISLLTSRNKDFTLVFFSDDSDWVKEQFETLPYSKIVVDHNIGENSWKDMLLMSSCSHNIIANSSFSWWAAWLNENPEKIVIAPEKWFAEAEKSTKDLIPSEWIRL